MEVRGRLSNYTMQEDILLSSIWKVVSMDAVVDINQARDTYWTKMKEYYDTHNKSGIERTNKSLRDHWPTIQTDCQKWSACLESVEDMNPSGTNDNDRVIHFVSSYT
jgi:hypothetical protein